MREPIIRGDVAAEADPAVTVPLVPLTLLTDLARLGLAMRKTQRAYFDARRKAPHIKPVVELQAAIEAEEKFDAAVREALARERVNLPGMEGGAA